MVIDFWNTKLNPVTMWLRETDYKYEISGNDNKLIAADLLENPKYILQEKVCEVLGITPKKIKYTSYTSHGKVFHRLDDISEIEIVFESSINKC